MDLEAKVLRRDLADALEVAVREGKTTLGELSSVLASIGGSARTAARATDEFRRAYVRVMAREATKKLQGERPDEVFPGANGTGDMLLSCGHEQQSRGSVWRETENQSHVDRERIVHAFRRTMPQEDAEEAARAYARPPCEGLDHQGRCLGCQHCGGFTAEQTRLW